MRKIGLLTFLISFISMNFAASGHFESSSLGFNDGNFSSRYTGTGNPNYRQAYNSTVVRASNAWSVDQMEVYVLFEFDTSGKSIFLVYTVDGTTPSKSNGISLNASFDKNSFSNNWWRSIIPAQTAGTEVRYIFYISDTDLASAWGRVAGTSQYETTWTEGDDYFSYTVNDDLTYHSVGFSGLEADWLSNELLGIDGNSKFYLSWDETFIYIGWLSTDLNTFDGGDRFNLGIDLDPGSTNGITANFSGLNFSTNNDGNHKLDYIFQFHNPSGSDNTSFKLFSPSGGNWDSGTEKFSTYAGKVNYSASGGDYQVRIPWSEIGGRQTDSWGVIYWTNNNNDNFVITSFPSSNPTGNASAALDATDLFVLSNANSGQSPSGGSVTPLPVELTSFSALSQSNIVNLSWETATEVNNYGFEIERTITNSKLEIPNWEKVGFVEGHGNSNSAKQYTYVDNSVREGQSYSYRLKQIDFDGQFEYSNVVNVEVGVPMEFSLAQNYPNPFNPSTSIEYSVPSNEFVTLKVYDVLGNTVSILVNETKEAGKYNVTFDASNLTSGIYFYSINAGGFTQVKKMMLVK